MKDEKKRLFDSLRMFFFVIWLLAMVVLAFMQPQPWPSKLCLMGLPTNESCELHGWSAVHPLFIGLFVISFLFLYMATEITCRVIFGQNKTP